MDVVFVTTSSQNIDNVEIKNGQIIALNDSPGYFYDHHNTRYRVGGIMFISDLPDASSITPGDTGLYILSEQDRNGFDAGIYQFDFDNNRWRCIASGTISSDAPNDEHEYVRKHGQWVEPHNVIQCTGQLSDITRINAAIQNYYHTAGQEYCYLHVTGNLQINNELPSNICINATRGKILVLDFEGLVLRPDESYDGSLISITYEDSYSSDNGCVLIKNLDAHLMECQLMQINTIQSVKVENCNFQHVFTDVNLDNIGIDVQNASSFEMQNCRVWFEQDTDGCFINLQDTDQIASITHNLFQVEPSQIYSELALKLAGQYSNKLQFEDNIVIGSIDVEDGTSLKLDLSANNITSN